MFANEITMSCTVEFLFDKRDRVEYGRTRQIGIKTIQKENDLCVCLCNVIGYDA